MKIRSSWIFMEHLNKNEKKDETPEETLQLDLERSVYSFIQSSFPSVERVPAPISIFSSRLVGNISNCSVEFNIRGVGSVQYLDVSVEGETEELVIDCLEQTQNTLLQSGIKKCYVDINSYDAVSEHYCNKIVGNLNSFERNLRELLFNTYVLYFGENYYQATMDETLQDKIKGLINSSNPKEIPRIRKEYEVDKKQAKAILYLQHFFYSFELGDALTFLFSDNLQTADEPKQNEESNIQADLSKLTDRELNEVITSMSSKSDWDKFFSSKIHIDNVKEKITRIRQYRNSVAHFKHFSKTDYFECQSLLQELNTSILEAIEETKTVDFANRNKAIIKEALEPLLEKWMLYKKSIDSIFEKSFYKAFRDTISRLKTPPDSTG